MFPTNDPHYLPYRRELRQEQTRVELLLWKRLKAGRLNGHKFYRQFGIGHCILDFYCHEKRLAIELDGGQHADSEHREYDEQRTTFLNAQGIKVIRFWNNEVMENIEGVCERIEEYLNINSPQPLP